MTLNDLERRNILYFALFHRIRQLWRPITSQWLNKDLMFAEYRSLGYFWPKLTHRTARSLCDSWATCLHYCESHITFYLLHI